MKMKYELGKFAYIFSCGTGDRLSRKQYWPEMAEEHKKYFQKNALKIAKEAQRLGLVKISKIDKEPLYKIAIETMYRTESAMEIVDKVVEELEKC